MKKITTFLDKKLQLMLKNDAEFRLTDSLHCANAVVSFVVELVVLDRMMSVVSPPIAHDSVRTTLNEQIIKVFKETNKKTSRIEAVMMPVASGFGICIEIYFIDKKNKPLMNLLGSVNPSGVIGLRAMFVSDAIESATCLSAGQRRFMLIGRPY